MRNEIVTAKMNKLWRELGSFGWLRSE